MIAPEMATLLRRSNRFASYGMLLAGVIHAGLTPIVMSTFDQEMLWFVGTGLALCYLGLLNLLRQPNDHAARWFGRSANVIGTLYMLVVAVTLQAPHVYLVLAFIVIATIDSFVRVSEPLPMPEHL